MDEGETEVVSVILEEIPPEAPKRATLEITSEPTGATVYIDGKWSGTITPYTVKKDAGRYIIRLTLAGYDPRERVISLEWEELKTEHFDWFEHL